VIPLLAPDVDTLADYGEGTAGLVRLADRSGELRLLAFPRAESSGGILERGRWRSRAGDGRWRLDLRGERKTAWTVEASLDTLEAPFVPCGVRVNRRPLASDAWSFDAASGVLRVRATGRGIRLEAVEACG
jgi:hypothetical protein